VLLWFQQCHLQSCLCRYLPQLEPGVSPPTGCSWNQLCTVCLLPPSFSSSPWHNWVILSVSNRYNWAVCTLRIMLNWWKQWAARAMVTISAKHWQVIMIQSSSTTVPPSWPFWLDQSFNLWSTLGFFDLSCIAFHIY
jgi:hypothetical protein